MIGVPGGAPNPDSRFDDPLMCCHDGVQFRARHLVHTGGALCQTIGFVIATDVEGRQRAGRTRALAADVGRTLVRGRPLHLAPFWSSAATSGPQARANSREELVAHVWSRWAPRCTEAQSVRIAAPGSTEKAAMSTAHSSAPKMPRHHAGGDPLAEATRRPPASKAAKDQPCRAHASGKFAPPSTRDPSV